MPALLFPPVDKWASIFHFEALFPFAICQVPFRAPSEDWLVNTAPPGKARGRSDCRPDCWLPEIKFFAGASGEAPMLPFDNHVELLQDESRTSRRAVAMTWNQADQGSNPALTLGELF